MTDWTKASVRWARKTKPANTASLRKAKQEHEEFLQSVGIDPTKKTKVRKRGVWTPEKRDLPKIGPSNQIPGTGLKKDRMPDTGLMIAQTYNKGPLMVVGSSEELKGSKRRD